MNDELERENKILKEKVEDLKDQLGANNGQITGELTAAGDASANCQKCSDLQKEVHFKFVVIVCMHVCIWIYCMYSVVWQPKF